MKIVLASRNPKKVQELCAILAPFGAEIVPVSEFQNVSEVEETGATFEENAILKAESIRDATGCASIGDDSGLVVDALGGAPGVRSARFAGEDADDKSNNNMLLDKLQDIPADERSAKFVCVIALAIPGKKTRCFRGETGGKILSQPIGINGFGYDPLFWSVDLKKTFAEATSEEKHAISHRGRALAALLEEASAILSMQ